ncbi:MAG TPA: inosine/xanthosine triphosphatase [Candidatus Paceibacterota bacterium]|nr:inosine/xanthosine triphosphatase [Candidatus Paceibacterota bacterium]
MKKIIIASTNPVKISAVVAAFGKMFPDEKFETEGISAASEVSDQPKNDTETFNGAMNRAENASHMADGDFWVGIEGGVDTFDKLSVKEKDSDMVRQSSPQVEAFAWVVIKGKNGKFGKGKTGTFFLPPKVSELIKQGMELGEADDIVFKRENSKQKNGAVGILTGDVIDRTRYYIEAVVLALIPFKNEELYP